MLFLLRHGHAAPGRRDRERPLDARGRAEVEWVGAWLRRRDVMPGRVLVSPARRTGETLAGLGLPLEGVDISRPDALYLATASLLRRAIDEAWRPAETLLLVGHNPGLHELAFGLAGEDFGRLREGLPTGGLVCFARSEAGFRFREIVLPEDS